MAKALVIPPTGPIREISLSGNQTDDLALLQEIVGGYIEAVPTPEFFPEDIAIFINEDGKSLHLDLNTRATELLVPGLHHYITGDYIAGPAVVVGWDPSADTYHDIPDDVEMRVRLSGGNL